MVFCCLSANKVRVDVLGAAKFDIPPSFGLPTQHLPAAPISPFQLPPIFFETALKWNMFKPESAETMKIFEDLYQLNSTIVAGLPDSWEDQWLLGLQIHPIVLRFLRPYPNDSVCHERDTLEIALQLAALVYLADLRTRCMAYHTTGNHFSQRLKAIVISEGPEWNDFLQLRLWILVVGAVKASEEDRHLFGAAIKSVLETLGIVTWYGAMNVVENFVWME